MTSSVGFGVLLGGALSAFSILGNIRRGDPHLVSVFPGLIGVVLLALSVYFITRRQRGRLNRRDLLSFGLRQTLAAAVVFAASLTIFTLWWMPNEGPMAILLFTLGSTMGAGGCAAVLAARAWRSSNWVRT